MDANGTRFWMCSDDRDWLLGPDAAWDGERRVVRLASRRAVKIPDQDRDSARLAADGVRGTVDAYGTWAVLSRDRKAVLAAGAFPQPVVLFRADPSETLLDLAVGPEGVLWVVIQASDGARRVGILDLLERWRPVSVSRPDIEPDRILARARGGAWALDRKGKKLARLDGLPFPDHLRRSFSPSVARPCEENSNPPRMHPPISVPVSPEGELLAAAGTALGVAAFLLWPPEGDAQVILWDENRFLTPSTLHGLSAPFSIGWVGDDRWAVLLEGAKSAPVFRLPTQAGGVVYPLGEYRPLPEWNGGPFSNDLEAPVHYWEGSPGLAQESRKPRPLHPLSAPSLVARGTIRASRPFDGGSPGTVWHRLYLEGAFPPGTGARVRLAATDQPNPPAPENFVPFRFGSAADSFDTAVASPIPKGAWVPAASEIPFHPGFLDCPKEQDRAGLFTVLLQRPGTRVRTLQGRFLWMELDLLGTGQAGPEVAAVRVYAPRFSYRDRYLPELFRETLSGPEGDASGPPSGPDFLDRYLCLAEGILTPMEDLVAAAHVLTDPEAAPSHTLDWLASWLGLTLEPALSDRARRRFLREAMTLFRAHGTLAGLQRALDIVTDGGLSQGRIVVVEDFRLRRSFAAMLGVDLADEDDALTCGITARGNSIVGRTLFLGAEEEREFLALFRPQTVVSMEEEAAVTALWEQFAHRVTILLHRDTPEEMTALVRRVAAQEIPAHVEARFVAASENLVVGIASLLAVDTALALRPPLRPVTEDRSRLSSDATVLDIPGLDPRLV